MNKRTDQPKPIDPSLLPETPTPIDKALDVLYTAGALTVEEKQALTGLPGVRTYGDLLTALSRGDLSDMPGGAVERLRTALGITS